MQKNACFCHFFAVLLGMINDEKINNLNKKGNNMNYNEAVDNLLENIKIGWHCVFYSHNKLNVQISS